MSTTTNTLKRWTLPQNYFGEVWPNYYVFLTQHRDSDTLARSNFRSALKAIGGESDTLTVVRETHWAVGWVEWIGIHESDEKSLVTASEIKNRLENYPVVDEEKWSEFEQEEADQTWKNCYDPQERIDYIREHRSQFEFRSFENLIGCVRGKYFAGYASELIG